MNRTKRIIEIAAVSLVGVSVLEAHFTPATGYEQSIHSATPDSVWIGLGAALVLSVLLVFVLRSRIGYVSGLLALVSWSSMRLIRGYYIMGTDPLVHFGQVKYLLSRNELVDRTLFYPVTHLFSVNVSLFSNLPPRESLLLTTPVFLVLFVTFTPLAVSRIESYTRYSSRIGFFTGVLLLPINWLGVHIQPHPSTYAILAIPMVLFLVILYWRSSDAAIHSCLAIIILFFIHLHPLIALLLSGVLVTMALTRSVLNVSFSSGVPRRNPEQYWLVGISLGVIVIFKLVGDMVFQEAFTSTISQFGSLFIQGSTTTTRATSLSDVGVSPVVLIAKLFGASVVTGIIAVVATLDAISRWLSNREFSSEIVIMTSTGTLFLLPTFAVFFLSDFLLYFRVLGVLMVLVSIVFAVGMSRFSMGGENRIVGVNRYGVTVVVIVLLLVAALPIANPSPYIIQSSEHRTQSEIETVEVLSRFTENENDDVVTVRSNYPRLKWAVTGQPQTFLISSAPYQFNDQNLPAVYNDTRFLLITDRDYQTDVNLYNGIRYNASDFAYLDTEAGMDRIIDAGDGTVYRIPG